MLYKPDPVLKMCFANFACVLLQSTEKKKKKKKKKAKEEEDDEWKGGECIYVLF